METGRRRPETPDATTGVGATDAYRLSSGDELEVGVNIDSEVTKPTQLPRAALARALPTEFPLELVPDRMG